MVRDRRFCQVGPTRVISEQPPNIPLFRHVSLPNVDFFAEIDCLLDAERNFPVVYSFFITITVGAYLNTSTN